MNLPEAVEERMGWQRGDLVQHDLKDDMLYDVNCDYQELLQMLPMLRDPLVEEVKRLSVQVNKALKRE